MQNKIDKIKEFYSYDELMGLYFEWLDNNRYDRPLDSYEAQQYLHSLDVEELAKNLTDLDFNEGDYYEFSGYGYLNNIGDKHEVIDGYALCEDQFVNFVLENMNEEE